MSSATRSTATQTTPSRRTGGRSLLAASAAQERSVRRARRRRRLVAMVVFVAVLMFFAVREVSPLFQKALRDLTLPLQDSAIIRQQATSKRLDPALVAAVIYAETGFDARTSPAGAEGLMQIEPATAEALARQSGATTFHVSDLSTPAVNIAYGSYYLRELLDNFHGDETAALAAYNGGEGNVDLWISRAHQSGHAFSLTDIPFPATRAYVAKVVHAQTEYRQKYPAQLGLN